MTLIGTEPHLSHDLFLQIMLDIVTADNIRDLGNKSLKSLCYKHASYHHIPAIGSHDYSHLKRPWTFGIPKETLEYFEKITAEKDPVMEFCFQNSRPFWLSQILEDDTFSDLAARKRIESALKTDNDSIVFPLYGPFQNRAYAFMGFKKQRDFYDDIFMWQVHALIQAAHVKYCHLQESLNASVHLTKREAEVLQLITFGKTNPEIGSILGISTNTVSGYVKQIFLKLDVSDRVTAALRASTFSPNSY